MPQTSLTAKQREDFARDGILRFHALIPLPLVDAARAKVLARLTELPPRAQPPVWPDPGVTSQAVGKRHPEVARLIEPERLRAIVDLLLDGSALEPLFGRPQLLVTLPQQASAPARLVWHLDMPPVRDFPSERCPGVQLFVFLDTVGSGGGGTFALAGSHRLWERDGTKAVRRHVFIEALHRTPLPLDPRGRASYLAQVGTAAGVPLRLIEMVGAPGDAYLTDQRLVHCGSPNLSDRPRLMATHRFFRAGLMALG